MTDTGTRNQIVDYAQQSQFERIAGLVPTEQLSAVFDAVRSGFTSSVHDTFTAGALICLVAAAVAFFLRDPVREPLPKTAEREVAAPVAAD